MKLKDFKEEIRKIELENSNADEMEVEVYFNSLSCYNNIWLQTNEDNEIEIHWMI